MGSKKLDSDFPLDNPCHSLITFSNLPPFTFKKSKKQRGIFYGVLRTNENLDELWKKSLKLTLDTTFMTVGLGASFIILHYFFKKGVRHILFCDREPYVYLFGKIIFLNLKNQSNIFHFLMYLLDNQKFISLLKKAVLDEEETSSIFLRKNRKEWMNLGNIPREIDYLRFRIFDRDSPLLEENFYKNELLIDFLVRRKDRRLIKMTVEDQQNLWLRKFLESKRMGYVLRLLKYDYQYFQRIANSQICEFYCVDIFHPDFWRYLSYRKDLWKNGPGIFYFSNAAVYSKNLGIRNSSFAISSIYNPTVVKFFEQIVGQRNYYIYTISKDYYVTKIVRSVPTLKELLVGFS